MKASESLQNDQSTATENALRLAVDITPAFIHTARPDGYFDCFNPLRFGIDTGAEWDSHIPLLHPDDHEETRRVWSTCLRTSCAGEVSFRVRNAEGGYRWFLSASKRSGRAMGLYCIGSGSILTLKNANVRKRSCGGVKRIYLKRLPLTDLLGWGWTPSS